MRLAVLAAVLAAAAAVVAAPAAAAAPPAAWKANCVICHQAEGQGLAGQFPRLTGRVSVIAAKPDGRAYLTAVVTNGIAGRITVDGTSLLGVMPSFATLPDADLAAALNFAARGGKAAPFKPADIAAARKTPMGNSAMTELRAKLVADGTIP